MDNNNQSLFAVRSEVTQSYWTKEEGFSAQTLEEAAKLTKHEVSVLHWTFPKLKLVEIASF